jgi:signal transduction histidine kinase
MRIGLVLIFLILVKAAYAVDKGDTAIINRLNEKAQRYYLYKPDSSILLANQAITLAEIGGYKFESAFGFYVLSKAYWAKANYLLSIHYGFKALKIYENTDQIYNWGECNLAIARTFSDLRKFNQCKAYIEQTIILANRNNNLKLLAAAHREKSFLLLEQKFYDSALFYSNKGIDFYEQEHDTLHASILYGRLTRIYLELKNYKKSLAYAKRSILMDSLSGNRRALGISYFLRGQIYYALNKKDSALISLRKSLPISKGIRNLSTMIKTHQLVAQIYEERNQLALASAHLKMVSQYKDSLYNLDENGQIEEILSNYELASKEKTIQSLEVQNALEKQKNRNNQLAVIFISVVAGLLATLSIVFWRMRQWQVKEAKTLQEVSQLKSKLFSVISHDLRGPINNLQSLLEMVTKEYVTQEEFKNISIKLKSSLNASQNTLENLLNWSLSQMEGIRTQKTNFNITNIIHEVTALAEETASKKKITIDSKSNEVINVNADINQVTLILRNILHNAIKFSRHNSSILIRASSQKGFCSVSISDTGLGMTTEEISTVLNSNEYFTKSGTDKEKGTGLGFLLCKDFIKRNGGEVSVVSELGKGTEVTFTLPLA